MAAPKPVETKKQSVKLTAQVDPDQATLLLPDGSSISGRLYVVPGENTKEYYDGQDRLLARVFDNPTIAPKSTLVYSYNEKGQNTKVTAYYPDLNIKTITEYFYNPSGNLTSVKNTRTDLKGNNPIVDVKNMPSIDYDAMQKTVRDDGNVIEYTDSDGHIRRRETFDKNQREDFVYHGSGELHAVTTYRDEVRVESAIYTLETGKINYALIYNADGLSVNETRVYLYGNDKKRAAKTAKLAKASETEDADKLSGIASYKGAIDDWRIRDLTTIDPTLRRSDVPAFVGPDGQIHMS